MRNAVRVMRHVSLVGKKKEAGLWLAMPLTLIPLDRSRVDTVHVPRPRRCESRFAGRSQGVPRRALGDQAPLVTANPAIGSLEPSKRGLAGKNLGQARKALTRPSSARQGDLAAEHGARMLVGESVDVTVPTRRAGARHWRRSWKRSLSFFVAMDWRDARRGSRDRARVVLRFAQLRHRSPCSARCTGHPLHRRMALCWR